MNRQRLNVLGVAMFLIGWLGSCGIQPAATPTPSPLDLVSAFQTAYNRHDAEAVLALLTEDIKWATDRYTTHKDVVRNILEFAFEVKETLYLVACKPVGSTVTCTSSTISDCQPPDLMTHAPVTFKFTKARISAVIVQPVLYQHIDRGDYYRSALIWASQHLRQDYARYSALEWSKLGGNGHPVGDLSAQEFGQLVDLFCTSYAAIGD